MVTRSLSSNVGPVVVVRLMTGVRILPLSGDSVVFITVSLLVMGLEYSRVVGGAVFGTVEVLSSSVVVGRVISSIVDVAVVAGVTVVVGKAVVSMVLCEADVVGDSVVVGGTVVVGGAVVVGGVVMSGLVVSI